MNLFMRIVCIVWNVLWYIVACGLCLFSYVYVRLMLGNFVYLAVTCILPQNYRHTHTNTRTKQLSFPDMYVHKYIECLACVCVCAFVRLLFHVIVISFWFFGSEFSGWYFRMGVKVGWSFSPTQSHCVNVYFG